METVNSSRPLLAFPGKVRRARLVRRRLRFLMDLENSRGIFTAHTNNTGTMLGLLRPGCEVLYSVSVSPGRKHPATVEALRPGDFWVGVNTAVPTRILKAAWEAGLLPECAGYTEFTSEPRFEHGRLDARFSWGGEAAEGSGPGATAGADRPGAKVGETGPKNGVLYVEAKNVTLVEDCAAQFPDAPSERACKHLVELTRLARSGVRAALFFAVQRPDGQCFAPAEAVDPEYAALFRVALSAGVEAWAYVVDVAEDGYRLGRRLSLAP